MKLQHKIKTYFKTRDFHLWKDLRFDQGLSFVHPTEEILIEIASYLVDMEPCDPLEDKRFRMKETTAVAFDNVDEMMPWLSRIVRSDFEETSQESKIFDWKFRYQLKPYTTSVGSHCLSNALTSLKKENSHCIYALVSIRKFSGKYYCWTF
ncbi:hypothetical protein [Flavobacterium selenitireducens]|uniref:hypothetical protein n=1 Tax=Flavobacterium selenitireducens TaxID=2722704 RepID=UPI00168A89C2|nr:hypothetical protein [Flavobacterium selenitireducens]MBD3582391.1 hypothetical protein [Flavobacterium selenitireducens]